jgi:hypothetical protein
LGKGNSRIAAAPKYSTARGIVARDNERKAASVKEAINGKKEKAPNAPILNTNFHDWQPGYAGEKFNFIHCDFPYGVNVNKWDMQYAAGSHEFGDYDDSFDNYMKLLDRLEDSMKNVVAESAHLMFWFSMTHYERTLFRLEKMGWKVDPFPLIWFKSDNSGIAPDTQRGPRRVYETCFFAHRGDRKVVLSVSNCYAMGVVNEVHMSEKPLPMLRHFMRMIVDEYTTCLDPTCGSGNALIASKLAGANSVKGLELSPEHHARATANWNAVINRRDAEAAAEGSR